MDTYLFFGSFNPIHNGHVALAKYILDNTSADLWFVVSPQNPHKDPADLSNFSDRLAMVVAVAETLGKRAFACDIEESLPKPSYTINTVEKLIETYPERKFLILAGSDIADTLHTWHRYEELLKKISFKIYPRQDDERGKCSPEFKNAPVLEQSSTDFRSSHNLGLLPQSAAEYIVTHGLYKF